MPVLSFDESIHVVDTECVVCSHAEMKRTLESFEHYQGMRKSGYDGVCLNFFTFVKAFSSSTETVEIVDAVDSCAVPPSCLHCSG